MPIPRPFARSACLPSVSTPPNTAQLRLFQWTAAAVILLSAFLLFQVQPLISRIILPWFGGTPAVWTTCMLFFQTLLLGGYAYAHGLSRLRPRHQWWAHGALLLAACLLLPIAPDAVWKPTDSLRPTARILLLLAVHVGLPYFLLSATGPLVQSWYSRTAPGSPYRLYSLSNVGSLAALLSYPLLLEPHLPTSTQALVWSLSFAVFAISCAELARRFSAHHDRQQVSASTMAAAEKPRLALWILLPALGSCALLAVTARICRDVAVSPFMWVVPLSLYLLTFIICFDHERWYRRLPMAVLLGFSILAVCFVMLADEIEQVYGRAGIYLRVAHLDNNVLVESTTALAMLFLVCMVCHGEVVRLKPPPARLTMFYLAIAAGGALGGLLVGVICPLVFSFVAEWHLSLVAGLALASVVTLHELLRLRAESVPANPDQRTKDQRTKDQRLQHKRAKRKGAPRDSQRPRPSKSERPFWNLVVLGAGLCTVAAALIVLWAQFLEVQDGSLHRGRSFYGVLSVKAAYPDDPAMQARVLYSGRIMHGYQWWSPEKRATPTTYYDRRSGIGATLTSLSEGPPLRVGVVGLGAGTLAAYARPDDLYRFYEINPLSIQFAFEQFAFLPECQGTVETVLGDARIALENEQRQRFDVLVLDAFSGDAIPIHLLTREAFEVYIGHLAAGGLICVHISNRHLDLASVLAGLSQDQGLDAFRCVQPRGDSMETTGSDWVILSRDRQRLETVQATAVLLASPDPSPIRSLPDRPHLWTDDFSNLLEVLR